MGMLAVPFQLCCYITLQHTLLLFCFFKLGLHSGSHCTRIYRVVQAGLKLMPQPPKYCAWLDILSLSENDWSHQIKLVRAEWVGGGGPQSRGILSIYTIEEPSRGYLMCPAEVSVYTLSKSCLYVTERTKGLPLRLHSDDHQTRMDFSLSLAGLQTWRVTVVFTQAAHPNMRTYYFCTDTGKEMELWMKAMLDAALVQTEPVKRYSPGEQQGLPPGLSPAFNAFHHACSLSRPGRARPGVQCQ